MNEEATQAGAALARRSHGRESHRPQREIKVGRRTDNGGIIAAQLEDGMGKAGGQARGNGTPHRRRAGGGDQRHARMLDEDASDVAPADDEARQPHRRRLPFRREARQRALEQGVHGQRRERGPFGGLPDAGVATYKRQGGIP
jgi:hypothetical protein